MKIAIYGYGNLGRGVERAIREHPDAELFAVFTRRRPKSIQTEWESTRVLPADQILSWKDAIDVLIICGGSARDLPDMTPYLAAHFHVLDSFDTHAAIPEHFAAVDRAARETGHLALISAGWDPGLFSIARLYAEAVLPRGKTYTFWGRGVSQGHSDAIRHIDGVLDARQYTVPVEEMLAAVRRGEMPDDLPRKKHRRICYVVAEQGANLARITREIKSMPHYFADYDTEVHFLSQEELLREHGGMPHGGTVIRNGKNGSAGEERHTMEFCLDLGSNPAFTAGVLVAYARALFRMAGRGLVGGRTVLDVAPADLSPLPPEEQRARLL